MKLELRQYKNDAIQSKIIPTLKLPRFFTPYTALWFRMKPFCSENKKMQNCPDFEKDDIFHIYIIWTIHINHLKSHMYEVIGSV